MVSRFNASCVKDLIALSPLLSKSRAKDIERYLNLKLNCANYHTVHQYKHIYTSQKLFATL